MTFAVPKDSDAAEIFAILGDPSAMRFTEVWPTIDACRNKLAVHRAQRAAIGYGPWAIRLGDDRRIIGWGGLYVDPFDAGWGLEIGYFLAPAAWGRGVATELVGFLLRSADQARMERRSAEFQSPKQSRIRPCP